LRIKEQETRLTLHEHDDDEDDDNDDKFHILHGKVQQQQLNSSTAVMFELLTAMNTVMRVFRTMTPCILVDVS
jgi:hypothetical protein